MSILNRGVCMFKLGKFKEACEIWVNYEQEHAKNQHLIAEFIAYNDNC